MNDQDYIRAAVKLADGWRIAPYKRLESPNYSAPLYKEAIAGDNTELLDALAAQLVRQIPHPYYVSMTANHSIVMKIVPLRQDSEISFIENEWEWAMNTIKAIVNSGVLASSERV